MHTVWIALRTSLTSRQHNMEDGDTIDAHLQQVSPSFTCFASSTMSFRSTGRSRYKSVHAYCTGTVASGVERIIYGLGSTVQSLVHEISSGRQVEPVSGPPTPYQSPISLCNLVTASRSRSLSLSVDFLESGYEYDNMI